MGKFSNTSVEDMYPLGVCDLVSAAMSKNFDFCVLIAPVVNGSPDLLVNLFL